MAATTAESKADGVVLRAMTVADLPASTVRHYLSRPQSAEPAQKTNGHDVRGEAQS